jgi:hypothetical protein
MVLLCQPHISPWGEDIIQFFDPLNWGGITKTFYVFIIAFGVTPIVVSACNGAYVFGGQFTAEEADDFNFAERFSSLKAEFENQLKEEAELNERILDNLAKVKVDGPLTSS